jgi:hypothetical protein
MVVGGDDEDPDRVVAARLGRRPSKLSSIAVFIALRASSRSMRSSATPASSTR